MKIQLHLAPAASRSPLLVSPLTGGWIASAKDYVRFETCIDGYTTRPDVISAASVTTMSTPTTAVDVFDGCVAHLRVCSRVERFGVRGVCALTSCSPSARCSMCPFFHFCMCAFSPFFAGPTLGTPRALL
jgi:hypothetical protein